MAWLSADAKLIIKSIIFAWVIPIALVVTILVIPPNPFRSKDSFPSTTFTPKGVSIERHAGSRGSDHFELWLRDNLGNGYFHRDPEREPIAELERQIPRNVPLAIVYEPRYDGNVLLEIALSDNAAPPILCFADIMEEYAWKRHVVFIVAGVWSAIGNVWLYFVWRAGKGDEGNGDNSH
jgi:hypothetical protein